MSEPRNVRFIPILTVAVPWSAAVIEGVKPIENRNYNPLGLRAWRPGLSKPKAPRREAPFLIGIHAGLTDFRRDLLVTSHEEPTWRAKDPSKPSHVAMAAAYGGLSVRSLTLGAILGVATLVETHPDAGCCRPWGEPSYFDRRTNEVVKTVWHWRLENPVQFEEPIPCKGRLSLWTLNDWLAGEMAAEMTTATGEEWEA